MKKAFFALSFAMMLFISSNVQAAGNVSLITNKTNVDIGEEFTVSISISSEEVASLTARVTVDTSKVEFVSGPSNSNFRNGRIIYTWTDPNGGESPITNGTLATFTLRAKASGAAGFSVSGDFYSPQETAINLNFTGATVTINEQAPVIEPEPEEPPISSEPTEPSTPAEPENPTTSEIPNNPEEPNEPANIENQNKQVNPINNEEIPNISGNTDSASSDNLPKTEDTPSAQQNLSFNTNLKSLRLDIATIIPEFSPSIFQYETNIDENIENIDVLATPEDSKSNISITGNNNLQIGRNTISIIVTAENGEKKEYKIVVNKSELAKLSNSFLENLAIENAELIPEFRYDIYEYNAEIDNNIENVNILAVPQRKSANITIVGNDNLQPGDNQITVMVTSEDGTTSNTYKINVHKKTEAEEIKEENENNKIEDIKLKGDSEELTRRDTTGHIIMAIVISLSTITTITILIWKYKNE
ncbi:MAG: cadherin-like beta sandwich domain-containing protein [Clostridia bacterium]|nr:cadherin-like beta sandwich domain-containing protein [Clostridia bacterium]